METEPVQIPAEHPPIISEPDVLPMTTPPAVAVEFNEGKDYFYLKSIFNRKLSTTIAVYVQNQEVYMYTSSNLWQGSTFRTK